MSGKGHRTGKKMSLLDQRTLCHSKNERGAPCLLPTSIPSSPLPDPRSSPSHFTLIPTLLQFIWKHSLVYQLYQLKDKLLWFSLQSTNESRCLSILWRGFHPSIPAGTPSPRTQPISPSHSSASKVWEDLLPNPPSPGLAPSVKDQVLKLYASLYQQPIF